MKLPLRFTIPAVLIIFTIVLAIWSLKTNGQNTLRNVESSMLKNLNNTLTILQEDVEAELRINNYNRIHRKLTSLSSNDNLKNISLIDDNNKVVTESQFDLRRKKLEDILPSEKTQRDEIQGNITRAKSKRSGTTFLSIDRNTLWGIYPVRFGSELGSLRLTRMGVLIAQVDLVAPKSIAWSLVRNQVYQFCLFIGLLVVGVGLFIHFQVTRRIQRLVIAAEEFSKGAFKSPIHVEGQDEIANLAKSMVKMAEKRQMAEKKLRLAQGQLLVSQKLAAIGQLSAGVSHEVLNPLNIISVQNQMLQKRNKDNEKLQTFCHKVNHEIERIKKIMNALLDFSRKREPKLEKGLLNDEIEKVLKLVEKEYKLENIRITRNWCVEPTQVPYDPDKIRQVFLNLLQNAKHAMPDGGTIGLGCNEIIRGGKKYLQLKISDTGTGMSEEVRQRIFEPFFTTKPEGEGTGMGLSVIHGIIEEHGGEITVESQEGQGTTFFIILPVSQGD